MRAKKAINIFLSVFNLSLDSDVKYVIPFNGLNIVDYSGQIVGHVSSLNKGIYYSIEVFSPEIGVMHCNAFEMGKSYDFSCTIVPPELNPNNELYDKITDNMNISFDKETQIVNYFSAYKGTESVIEHSFNSKFKAIKLKLNDTELTLTDYEDLTFLSITAASNFENTLRGFKKRNTIEYSTTSDDTIAIGVGKFIDEFEPYPNQTMLEAMFIRMNSFCLPQKIREASKQSLSLNYFDNICSLLFSCSTVFDVREVMALFDYIPNKLPNTPKIVNGTEVLYPGDVKPSKHIARPE